MEEWRYVPGTNKQYQISISTKEGKCRSVSYNHTGKVMELSNKPNKYGRLYWRLPYGGKHFSQQAARWIALTYPELVQNEYFEGAEIDHIDTDPMNNHPSNLRWVTRKGNCNNPKTKLHYSEAFKGRKATEETKEKMSKSLKGKIGIWVIQLSNKDEILHFYRSSLQAERETGISQSNITKCCSGKRKSAGGYKWKYSR